MVAEALKVVSDENDLAKKMRAANNRLAKEAQELKERKRAVRCQNSIKKFLQKCWEQSRQEPPHRCWKSERLHHIKTLFAL